MRAVARVDLSAVRHNAGVLDRAAGSARLAAVVKADGYGHGAVAVARAVLEGGARELCVAAVGEAEELRRGGIAVPIMVMGPLRDAEFARAAAVRAAVVVWTPEAVRRATAAGVGVHIKIDTGMGRLGARPEVLPDLVEAACADAVRVVGLMTHFATADDRSAEGVGFLREQALRFRSIAEGLADRFPDAVLHAANSAATLSGLDLGFGLVRCGVALYGLSPFHGDPDEHDLRPAMAIESYLGSVKTIRSRDSVGYGRTHRAARGTRIGLVPVGYADGYRRSLSNVAEVLVGGRRVPVVGAVSMDQLTVDLGPEATEGPGEPVVLMGTQGGERITAEELASWQGTINYEVVCAVGPRIARVS